LSNTSRTNTNTYKSAFWAFAHLLNDTQLLAKVQREVDLSFQDSDKLDLAKLMDDSPWLSALFYESLRICSASSSMRIVTKPTVIHGKSFPIGSRIMIPFRQLHFNAAAYGSDVNRFNPKRFVHSKTLAQSPSFRPFGGGISYCPGRFIAKQEVCMFIALVLKNYDVEVVGDDGVPALDTGKPTTGLMSPVDGEDTKLRLRPKPVVI
jgi:cytochrome P450